MMVCHPMRNESEYACVFDLIKIEASLRIVSPTKMYRISCETNTLCRCESLKNTKIEFLKS